VAVAYKLGPISGVGDWDFSVSGRNLLTISGYRGFDPEVGIAGNNNDQSGQSRAINAVDAFVFPNTRTFTFRLATTF
jgi:hypothetical protein